MATEEKVAPPKSGTKGLLVIVIISLVAVAAGSSLPFVWNQFLDKKEAVAQEPKPAVGPKLAFVPFEQVVVNVNEERLARFLRIKLIIVSPDEAKSAIERLGGSWKPSGPAFSLPPATRLTWGEWWDYRLVAHRRE